VTGLGLTSLSVLIIDGEKLPGFNPSAIDAAVAQ
jgi:hypothetical protein